MEMKIIRWKKVFTFVVHTVLIFSISETCWVSSCNTQRISIRYYKFIISRICIDCVRPFLYSHRITSVIDASFPDFLLSTLANDEIICFKNFNRFSFLPITTQVLQVWNWVFFRSVFLLRHFYYLLGRNSSSRLAKIPYTHNVIFRLSGISCWWKDPR